MDTEAQGMFPARGCAHTIYCITQDANITRIHFQVTANHSCTFFMILYISVFYISKIYWRIYSFYEEYNYDFIAQVYKVNSMHYL